MKKILYLCIVLLLLVPLAGCAAQSSDESLEEVVAESVDDEAEGDVEEETVADPTCPGSTLADPQGVSEGKWPQQYTLSEYEELAECEMGFNSREDFDERLWNLDQFFGEPDITGTLPPVEERLPVEPLVVAPYEAIGNYGGVAHYMSYGPESGDSGFLSVKHVNLVRFLDDGETIVPWVAKDYEISDDYKTITLWLREGHKWSDGAPFTADDILFWWEDIMLNEELFPDVPSQWVFGGEPMDVEKVSDTEFKIHLAAPVADSLLNWMGRTWIQMWAPAHAFKQFHPDYNPEIRDQINEDGYEAWPDFFFEKCYSTWRGLVDTLGLPELESHILVEETTDYQVFAPNPYFFMVDTAGNQLPYIDELQLTWGEYATFEQKIINGSVTYKGQNLQISSAPLFKQYQEDGGYRVELSPGVTMGSQITFNCTHEDPVLRELYQNVKFKEAMSLAINREEMAETVYFGLAEPQQYLPVNPDASFAKDEWYDYLIDYDPERANELLDEIGLDQRSSDGWRLRPDGEVLVVNNVYAEQGANTALMELLVEYWEAVGLKTKMKTVSSEAYRTLVSQNEHDVATFTSGGTWEPILHSDPFRLVPPFGDPALEPLCGGPWLQWMESDGEEGMEPPDDVKMLFTLVPEWKVMKKGTPEYEETAQEIIEILRDNFFHIGLVSDTLRITVIDTDLVNVPEITYQAFDLYRTYPYRTPQWFFGNE